MSLTKIIRYTDLKVSKEIVTHRAYLNIGCNKELYNNEKEHKVTLVRDYYNNALYGLKGGYNVR